MLLSSGASWWPYVVGTLGVALAAVLGACIWATHRVPRLTFAGKRVLITGGSTGIGLSVAKEIARRGGHVAVAARREAVLREAVKEIKAVAAEGVQVTYTVVDVSDIGETEKAVANLSKRMGGAIDVLICSAGFAHPSRFLDCPPDVARSMMDINYFGCVNAARAVLPQMLEQGFGRVVVVSSMASVAAVAGFTAYSPTKAAIRAFAQAMDMEHAPLGVRFQVVNPPDVATPGYEKENLVKSEECKRICAMGGAAPFTPDAMAASIVAGIERFSFQVNLGFDGWLLGTGSAGMEAPTSVLQLAVEVLFGGIVRLIGVIFTRLHYNIVASVRKEESKRGSAKHK